MLKEFPFPRLQLFFIMGQGVSRERRSSSMQVDDVLDNYKVTEDEAPYVFGRGPVAVGTQDSGVSSMMASGENIGLLVPSRNRSRARANTLSASNKDEVDVPIGAHPAVFKWEGGGQKVFISGTFSNWKPIPMVKSHKDFVAIVNVDEGDHEYKFLVDGQWMHDSAKETVNNSVGTVNNRLQVRKADFDVLNALALDSVSTAHKSTIKEWPQDIYGQEVPKYELVGSLEEPPMIPPHLLEVILNKDTPLSCEPTLLPEPHHVMLNHLYALSIRDGVMVLSATHRYKKKCVTSVLYKPIITDSS